MKELVQQEVKRQLAQATMKTFYWKWKRLETVPQFMELMQQFIGFQKLTQSFLSKEQH